MTKTIEKIEENLDLDLKIQIENNGVKITTYKSGKPTPSQKHRKKITHTYDPNKIFITKAGKTYLIDDFIKEQEPETNIYKVMEMYNFNPDEATERMKGRFQEIKATIDMSKSYAEHLMLIEKAKQEFELLPVNVKKQFNNSITDFMENGENWINEQIKNMEAINE